MRPDTKRPVPAKAERPASLPADIAFLTAYGIRLVDLQTAQAEAKRIGAAASDTLIANRLVSAARYYLCLADHLDLPFVGAGALLESIDDPGTAIRQGRARLTHMPKSPRRGMPPNPAQNDFGAGWLLAPRGRDLAVLLSARDRGLALPPLAITTPTHFSALVRRVGRKTIARHASFALLAYDPDLCAKHAIDRSWPAVIAGAALIALAAWLMAPFVSVVFGLLFLASMTFRLWVCAQGRRHPLAPAGLAEIELPFYSILVPLYHEASMVPHLIAALDAIDYPAAKLEIKIILEGDDTATRDALSRMALSPVYEVIIAPDGYPRTKPRALNVALPFVRGEILTIYDAEDRPEPGQLREAAARFKESPALACLQARLAVHPSTTDRLTRLFAIEYAALFDGYNIGVAAMGMPLALGGTSNHFRTKILRDVGGWDAWNVAEDADLGFRLARFGYGVGMLASTTFEQAPGGFKSWFDQRRRWTKGWDQTVVVLGHKPLRTARELGLNRTAVLVLMATSLILGPLIMPAAILALIVDLVTYGVPTLGDPLRVATTMLWASVAAMGMLVPLWCGFMGIRARGLKACLTSLPWVIPYQVAIALAAWVGLYDLSQQPYHWHKTQHRPE